MVKIAILGADTSLAGELIRIVINHPEIEIVSLFAPSLSGRNISSVHHGMVGESPLFFTDKLNLDEIDFIVVIKPNEITQNIIEHIENFENLKLVAFEKDLNESDAIDAFEIGISEINRKCLVRGGKASYITSPVVVSSLVTLIPLANFLLLNSDISIEVTLPAAMAESLSEEKEAEIIESHLKKRQNSFNGEVKLKIIQDHNNERAQKTIIKISNSLPVEEIEKIYEQLYDDHNFTFLSKNNVDSKEVEGTQKIIINLKKENPDTLVIESVSDARLRGGAGDIVHVMNLFFGLHEKTGLNLKPSRF